MGFPLASSSVGLSRRKNEIAFLPAIAISAQPDRLLGKLVCMVRANGIFAVSEICKGLAILTVGDMVIADGVGEFVCIVALTIDALPALRRRSSAHANRAALPSQ
ncbi:MAG TPA: hypothetical protein VIF88_11155 [Methylocystis sp.]|jgi:hypothetical protein